MSCGTKDHLLSEDVYLSEGEDIVASCFGISFRETSQILPALPSDSQSLEADFEYTSSGIRTPDSIEKCNLQGEVLPESPVSEKRSYPQQFPINTSRDLEAKALKIVSEEVSIDVSELEQETAFSDLGVDSLLSMSILDKIRRDTGLHLAASVFVSYATVSTFREYLRNDILAR